MFWPFDKTVGLLSSSHRDHEESRVKTSVFAAPSRLPKGVKGIVSSNQKVLVGAGKKSHSIQPKDAQESLLLLLLLLLFPVHSDLIFSTVVYALIDRSTTGILRGQSYRIV
jgi:hypothetical protein